ncbi:hypothetical protein thalar_02546 [Litoreibacter arenae DSM 19593]|uniref:Uncharacterized protein n=1 Tax=Litoreibacter arenae DSM 19593 TaxID=1123360 RepID=S9RS73_9RHOB|nr:hypothetical protein thalar_02546 [Litoreibacter arenae DSM 19593]
MTANRLVIPTAFLEKLTRRFFIWEFLEKLECAKCISHGPNLSC